MEWVELILAFIGMYAAYCLGHWTGYGKGYDEQQEFKADVHRVSTQEKKGL